MNAKLNLLTIAILSATAGSSIAVAQEQTNANEAEEVISLEKILVTASRRSESIEDIPYNISVFSGAEIEQRNILDTTELLRAATGVSIIDRGPRNAGVVNSIRIRGLNVDGSSLGDYAVSASATVSAYLNDTPMFASLLLKDIDQVEVLRGPQGTLYGSGALAGTVRFITNKPQLGEFSGRVGGSISQVKNSESIGYETDAIVNIPLGDTAALRLVGSFLDYPGITDYANVYELDANGVPVAPDGVLSPTAVYVDVEDADDYDAVFGRASLYWEPTDSINLLASYTKQSSDFGGRRGRTLGTDGFGEQYEEDEIGSIQLEPADADVEVGSLEANIDLGFATLTSSTSYYDHTGGSTSENTGFYAQNGWLAFYYNYQRPMASAVRTYEDSSFIQELRLVSNTGGDFDYIAGLYYQDQERQATQDSFLVGAKAYIDAFFGFDVPFVSGDQDFDFSLDEEFVQKAFFGELTYRVSDQLELTGGVRVFDNENTSTSSLGLPFFTDLFPTVVETVDQDENDTLYKANITYRFSVDSMMYGTFSQGFRRGGANGVPQEGFYAEDPSFRSYAPDFVDNYELGYKGITDSFRYSASLYYVDWQNPQLNTATPTWGFFIVGSQPENHENSASTKGIEVEIAGSFTPDFNYSLGYAFADAKLDADYLVQSGQTVAEKGTRLPGAPKHSLNAAVDYTSEFNGDVYLVYRADAYYQSETRNGLSVGNRLDQDLDGFAIFNASLTAAFDDVDVTFWVKNIFNEDGVSATFPESYMGTAPGEGYFGNGSKIQISLPRTFGLTANYRF
jgi:outer membrane receptor protein involved in Fe transport